MKHGIHIGLFFFILLLLQKGVHAVITQGPLNTVAKIGGNQVKLNCIADGAIGFWYLSKNGSSPLTIVGPGCSTVHPAFANHYSVQLLDGGHTCNLIVSNITMEQAGVYRCSEYDSRYSLFTVIENSPVITYHNSTGVVENENVAIECSLNYNGSISPAPTLRPYFYWTNSGVQNISSSFDLTTDNKAVSRIIVTAARGNITPYTCHVYLQLMPSTNADYANNTPTVIEKISSPTTEVLYGIDSVSVTQSTSQDGVFLTCNAAGNPAPRYSWTGPDGFINDTQQTIQIYDPGYYVCNATNEVRGRTYSITSGININNDSFTIWPPTTTTQASTRKESDSMLNSTATIVIAIVVSCWVLFNLIAMSAFLIYYNGTNPNGKHEHKKLLNNHFPWLKRMLPCLNEFQDGGCVRCLWVFLFLLMSITVGLIVFPIILMRANCTCCAKDDNKPSSSTLTSQEVQIELRPSDVRSNPSAPYEECSFPSSKAHQSEKSRTPKHAKVQKPTGKTVEQENDPYSVVRNPEDINVIHNTSVPLPPHQIPARNPNVPLYGHVNLASPSNLPKPVQLITDSETQYADLKNA